MEKKIAYPVNLVVECTTNCNLHCSICPHDGMKRQRGQVMHESVYKKIIKEIGENSPKDTILWHAFMGEPTTFVLLPDWIRKAREAGIENVWLNTNGMIYSPNIMAAGVTKVIVSIDAYIAETYSKIRCGGDYWRVRGNVHRMLEDRDKGQEVMVQFIVNELNHKEVEAFKEYWLACGATVKIRNMLGWGRSVKDSLGYENERHPCNWLRRQMVILTDGKVAQCDADYEGKYAAGDINEQSIAEVWNGDLARRRARHEAGDYDFEPCSQCDDWQVGRSEFLRK